jgi:REP element-mobilizing transposase RayT
MANTYKLGSHNKYLLWSSILVTQHSNYLRKCFCKERTFFSDGYFISSIGNVS